MAETVPRIAIEQFGVWAACISDALVEGVIAGFENSPKPPSNRASETLFHIGTQALSFQDPNLPPDHAHFEPGSIADCGSFALKGLILPTGFQVHGEGYNERIIALTLRYGGRHTQEREWELWDALLFSSPGLRPILLNEKAVNEVNANSGLGIPSTLETYEHLSLENARSLNEMDLGRIGQSLINMQNKIDIRELLQAGLEAVNDRVGEDSSWQTEIAWFQDSLSSLS